MNYSYAQAVITRLPQPLSGRQHDFLSPLITERASSGLPAAGVYIFQENKNGF
jgi:hypothetical protein